jgi:hypothetical protein
VSTVDEEEDRKPAAINKSSQTPEAPTMVPATVPVSIQRNKKPPAKMIITFEQLHKRLGHIPLKTIAAAYKANCWKDNVKVQWDSDPNCLTCDIAMSRKTNRKRGTVSESNRPGEILHLDVAHNPSTVGLTKSTYRKYYLGIADAKSHAYFLVGLNDQSTKSIIEALEYYAQYYRPHADYKTTDIRRIHADAGSQFISSELEEWGRTGGRSIVITTAAPHHQEQNGLAEN